MNNITKPTTHISSIEIIAFAVVLFDIHFYRFHSRPSFIYIYIYI